MRLAEIRCQSPIQICEAKEGDPSKGAIEALVTTFGPRKTEDGRSFFYKQSSFEAWAKEFAEKGTPLAMDFNHSYGDLPVGKWTEFSFTNEGMMAKGELMMNTSRGKDMYELIKSGMVQGVSVNAYANEYRFVDEEDNEVDENNQNAYFQIVDGGFREVSMVLEPANSATSYSMEYFQKDGSLDLRNIEHHLRELGVSRKLVVSTSSFIKELLAKRDAGITVTNEVEPKQRESALGVELLQAIEQRQLIRALEKRITV